MALRIETSDSEYDKEGNPIGAYWSVEAHHYNQNAMVVWFSHIGKSESDYEGATRFSIPNNSNLERAVSLLPTPTLKAKK